MKKFRIMMVGLLAAMMAVGCTSAYFSAASGSAYDDLYVSHDRTVIAERQRAEAEARKAEAEARRAEALALQAEYEAQLAQLNVQSAQNGNNQVIMTKSQAAGDGIIIIDEEQEHTYKSDMSPRYHARDIARFRAGYNNALMLLASATPSLESYYKAKQGVYTLITMKNRYGGATLPKVTVADMREENRKGNHDDHKRCNKGEVLPGHKALWLTGEAADSKKFFHV